MSISVVAFLGISTRDEIQQ